MRRLLVSLTLLLACAHCGIFWGVTGRRTTPDLVVQTVTSTVQVFYNHDTSPLPPTLLTSALQRMDRCALQFKLPRSAGLSPLIPPLYFCAKQWPGERCDTQSQYSTCAKAAAGSEAAQVYWSMVGIIHEIYDHRASLMLTFDPKDLTKQTSDPGHKDKAAGQRQFAVEDCVFPDGPPKVRDAKTGKMVIERVAVPPMADSSYSCVE